MLLLHSPERRRRVVPSDTLAQPGALEPACVVKLNGNDKAFIHESHHSAALSTQPTKTWKRCPGPTPAGTTPSTSRPVCGCATTMLSPGPRPSGHSTVTLADTCGHTPSQSVAIAGEEV